MNFDLCENRKCSVSMIFKQDSIFVRDLRDLSMRLICKSDKLSKVIENDFSSFVSYSTCFFDLYWGGREFQSFSWVRFGRFLYWVGVCDLYENLELGVRKVNFRLVEWIGVTDLCSIFFLFVAVDSVVITRFVFSSWFHFFFDSWFLNYRI